MTTIATYLQDCDDDYSPPTEPVLQISVVGDRTFLTLGYFEERSDGNTFKTLKTEDGESNAQITVSTYDLVNAIMGPFDAQKREAITLRFRKVEV